MSNLVAAGVKSSDSSPGRMSFSETNSGKENSNHSSSALLCEKLLSPVIENEARRERVEDGEI